VTHSEEREKFLEVFSRWLTAWKRILLQNGASSTVLESCCIRKCVEYSLGFVLERGFVGIDPGQSIEY